MNRRTKRPSRLRRGLSPLIERLEGRALLSTFTVTNPNDDASVGSLRWAIGQSNATAGPNTINFHIADAGVQTIAITSALPAITVPVTIDGTTEPGYGTTPVIELNGAGAGTSVDGLDIKAGNTTIKGLAINSFSREGINLTVAGDDTIVDDFLGTDPSGTVAKANKLDGIFVQSPSYQNTIANDLISGNTIHGIYLDGQNGPGSYPVTFGNLIEGNLIGTDVTGKKWLGNGQSGVFVLNAPSTTIGGTTPASRNVISGNADGLSLLENSDNTLIEGNYLGTDITGGASLTNIPANAPSVDGIILRGISYSTIGGTAAGAGNVISANTNYGIDCFVIGSEAIAIQGNLIGTDATGTKPLGNTRAGVNIGGPASVTVGGTVAGAGNVISGNLDDGLNFSGCAGLVVQGNYIGTDITGTKPLGNGGDGIQASQEGIIIGGTMAGAGNIIANNGLTNVFDHSGVVINSRNVGVVSDSIYNNYNLGIQLNGGANDIQAAPVLTSAVSMNTTSTISGTLTSLPGTYTLQFFSTPGLDHSGNAEGETFLGTASVTVAGSQTSFTLGIPSGFTPGTLISATATNASNNTSQFSKPVTGTGMGDAGGAPTIVGLGSPSSVAAGRDVTDTFTISNTHSITDSGVVFSDTIPAGTNFGSGTTSTGVPVVLSGGVATAAIGTLSAGQSVTVTIVLATSNAAIPSFINVGGVAATTPMVQPGTDTAAVTTTVTTSSDLSVSIVDGGSPPAGGPLDYTISVTNNGPDDDTNVILSDTLPAGVPYIGASSSQGTFSQTNDVFTANLGTLIEGVTAFVTIHLKPIVPGTVVDSATVGGDLPDPILANNQATFSVVVLPSADLAVSIAEVTYQPLATGPLDYQVTVTNNGPNPDTNVILTDTLPAGVPLHRGFLDPRDGQSDLRDRHGDARHPGPRHNRHRHDPPEAGRIGIGRRHRHGGRRLARPGFGEQPIRARQYRPARREPGRHGLDFGRAGGRWQ